MNITELKAKANELLRGSLKHAGTAALAGALIPLGAIEAEAGLPAEAITSNVIALSGGTYQYNFTINNIFFSSGAVTNFKLPLFATSDVFSVFAPGDWGFTIDTPANVGGWGYFTAGDSGLAGDPLKYGPNPQVFENPPFILSFNALSGGVGEGGSRSGFGFSSLYAPANAPFTIDTNSTHIVDPPTPLSPERELAQALPEPSSIVMIVTAAASAGVYMLGRSRKTK